ncbi:VWA domain-containing protein [Coprococcus eutactus]|uniref:vWA domain-containing protein n=1 Tax=Coprococcus eutactus TaxID=33043 RepID=UPI001C02F806|nr:VWA domain-containing protein [Coprococcus eutactus]MBT9731442.1 VWA domain-containing protein [Coprococcus eutactus]
MDKRTKGIVTVGVLMIIVMVAVIIGVVVKRAGNISSGGGGISGTKQDMTLDEMYNELDVEQATPVKGTVTLDTPDLYDELPEIDKYPLSVEGSGDVDIEIFTSGEKTGKDNDSWLIDVASSFNSSDVKTSDGKTVSMSVRSVPSGTAADYIISGKYLPDLYTPSNTLFGEYAISNNGSLELYADRLVGNTAGILVKKDSGYTTADEVIKAVQDNKITMGYTNPQTSATGLNLLLTLLRGGDDNFTKFNANIPYVAYTTQQMRDSASNGTLDAMLSEYQAYINDNNLTSMYDFIAFGVRHDNPVYICNKSEKTAAELEGVKLVVDYCKSDEMQKIAAQKGFNANDDYTSAEEFSGAQVTQGLKTYKKTKDNGKDIIAVFVADCSGSMDGDPMNQLKNSLTNGAQYINDNNYVGLVSYSNSVTIEVPIAQFDLNQRSYFQGAVNNLIASGGTASYDAVVVAVKMITEAKAQHPDAKCMLFLLSDGYANNGYSMDEITSALRTSGIPVYTIGYGDDADTGELARLSGINEAASINADSDDIIYKIKSLFNSQL